MDDRRAANIESTIGISLFMFAMETIANADATIELLLGLSKVFTRRRLHLQEEQKEQQSHSKSDNHRHRRSPHVPRLSQSVCAEHQLLD